MLEKKLAAASARLFPSVFTPQIVRKPEIKERQRTHTRKHARTHTGSPHLHHPLLRPPRLQILASTQKVCSCVSVCPACVRGRRLLECLCQKVSPLPINSFYRDAEEEYSRHGDTKPLRSCYLGVNCLPPAHFNMQGGGFCGGLSWSVSRAAPSGVVGVGGFEGGLRDMLMRRGKMKNE